MFKQPKRGMAITGFFPFSPKSQIWQQPTLSPLYEGECLNLYKKLMSNDGCAALTFASIKEKGKY